MRLLKGSLSHPRGSRPSHPILTGSAWLRSICVEGEGSVHDSAEHQFIDAPCRQCGATVGSRAVTLRGRRPIQREQPAVLLNREERVVVRT